MKKNILATLITAGLITGGAQAVDVSTKGGIKIKSDDGKYSAQVGGRIQIDFNRAELSTPSGDDTNDQTIDNRRARLYVKGKLGDDWGYKIQFNVDGSGEQDLYVDYKGWGDMAKLRIGNQKQPFGLEELTSSKDISVLERSAITEAYAIGREYGVSLSGANDSGFTYAIGYFDDGADDGPNFEGNDFAYAFRLTQSFGSADSGLFHVGLAYQDHEGDNTATGIELAFLSGPFHAQAELMDAEVGNTDADGYYIQLGYVMNGHRPYKNGKFKRVKPDAGGAWEFVLRLEDGDGNFSDIELGFAEAEATTVGVNYYANKYVRLGANFTTGELSSNSSVEGEEFRIRTQIAF